MSCEKQQDSLFNLLNNWAYQAMRAHPKPRDFAAWKQKVEEQAISFNESYRLLANDKCRIIAHNVAVLRWNYYENFLRRQRERGRKSGLANGRKNTAT